MDIFAELEKLRMAYVVSKTNHRCYEIYSNLGVGKHNETLDGIIEWLKIKQRSGCHIYGLPGICSMDEGEDVNDCMTARELKNSGKTKTDCQYWEELTE